LSYLTHPHTHTCKEYNTYPTTWSDAPASVRSVICNTEWENSHLSKEAKGKELEQIILANAFWKSAVKVLKVCEPIVDMLHMVDSDTPSMGFVYEGMDHYKEAIAKSFDNVENEYMVIW
jgi:hypothetical protein